MRAALGSQKWTPLPAVGHTRLPTAASFLIPSLEFSPNEFLLGLRKALLANYPPEIASRNGLEVFAFVLPEVKVSRRRDLRSRLGFASESCTV